MKTGHFIISVLLLIGIYLFVNRKPKKIVNTKYITKYEQRIDTLIKDTIVYKTKIRRFKDTIIIFRDSVREAKENNDTIKIIAYQDSVIEQQDYTIKWQDTLIDQLDTIIEYQNKVNDELKDSIVDLTKGKKKRKLLHILSVIGISTLFIIK
jgi:hypothetical protein